MRRVGRFEIRDSPLSLPLPQMFHTFAILCGCAPQGRLAHVLAGKSFIYGILVLKADNMHAELPEISQ